MLPIFAKLATRRTLMILFLNISLNVSTANRAFISDVLGFRCFASTRPANQPGCGVVIHATKKLVKTESRWPPASKVPNALKTPVIMNQHTKAIKKSFSETPESSSNKKNATIRATKIKPIILPMPKLFFGISMRESRKGCSSDFSDS